MRSRGRGDGGEPRWPRERGLAGARRGRPAALTWGPPAPDPTPRSGSSFPPCPCDFSTPESRSLGQVPPAASLPRGTPAATPLAAYHWLRLTPVTVSLAGTNGVQANRAAPADASIGWRAESESWDSGSHWPRRLDGESDARRALCGVSGVAQAGAPRVGAVALGYPLGQAGPTRPRVPLDTGRPIAGSTVRDVFRRVDPVPVS